MGLFFKKKIKWEENAKYKKGDYVNFRYRGELFFGYVFECKKNTDGKIVYTIQIAGQCPALIENYREEDILGLKQK